MLEESDHGIKYFRIIYCISQLIGIAMILLVDNWIFKYSGGLNWTNEPKQYFNIHPFLITFNIVLYGNSILIYRLLRGLRKKILKVIHFSIHLIILIFFFIASEAVFGFHNLENIPDLYSLHSWLGVATIILFTGQFCGGFILYLIPGINLNIKKACMPWHIYFGLFIFIMAIGTSLLGLNEKAIFSLKAEYSEYVPAGLIINFAGLLMVIYGVLVVYLATKLSYKRVPLPEELFAIIQS